MENRTKIICTIGPASESESVLKKMLGRGMDAVRLNFSHGNYAQFSKIIRTVRKLGKEENREIAIIQDLQGPKIRIGELPAAGILVERGDIITLTTTYLPTACLPDRQGQAGNLQPTNSTIPIQYRGLPRDVHSGDVIFINDGLIELKVLEVNSAKTKIQCKVEIGGVIKSHKGINVPTASISAHPLTEKDKKDVNFGVHHGVDYVALSFVREANNIYELKRLLRAKNSHAKVIAKIERHEAIKNLEGIIEATDAVMVARGDLGIEIPAEQVPLHQKKIIHLCNTYGKPVIVATEMLNSMISSPRATRAEISDAANAIFDHADALMLSNETAVGKYPMEATGTLAKVAGAVENDLKHHPHLLTLRRPEDMPMVNATCLNACKLAQDIHAKFIVAITRSGYTAREIAKYRSFIPIIVFTPDIHVARQMAIVWGVRHSFVQFIHLKNPLMQIRKTLVSAGLVKKGDEIVVCNAGFGRKEKLITTTMV